MATKSFCTCASQLAIRQRNKDVSIDKLKVASYPDNFFLPAIESERDRTLHHGMLFFIISISHFATSQSIISLKIVCMYRGTTDIFVVQFSKV